ncbi:MAG: hypothetical protein AABY93_05070 [Bacteroidota bacterium]
MKNNLLIRTLTGNTILISLLVGALILSRKEAIAQGAKDSASLLAGQADKLSFTMYLSSIVSNGNRSVKVQVRRKENKKTISVVNLKSPINLYLNEVKENNPTDGTGWISKLHLNHEGEGTFEFPSKFNKLTSGLHEYTFIAKMDSDLIYKDVEDEITISDAKIDIEYTGEDSIKTVTATLSAWKDLAYVPVPEIEVKLGIKRTFNFLPFGDPGLSTDENGEIFGELPLDIPGNANGTLTIVARLEDDETYGTVEATADIPWTVLPKINPLRGRTLWSSGDNAPLLLVISSVTIIVIIWGTIIYLIYLLFRIKRLSKASYTYGQK